MNFSKVLLFLFAVATLVTQVLLFSYITEVKSSISFYVFAVCSVLSFLINTYVTYHINFDVTEEAK